MRLSRYQRRRLKRLAFLLAAALACFMVIGAAVRLLFFKPAAEVLPGDIGFAKISGGEGVSGGASGVAVKKAPEAAIYINVYDVDLKKVVSMELEDYVYHVLAAEMPSSYDAEALKAQALAARTYAAESMRAYGGSGCQRAQNADVCTDSGHCQAFVTDEKLMAKWGNSYAFYEKKLKNAVSETCGEVILYEGAPILALFHSSSGGQTENVEEVFAKELPYLRSVESLGEENGANYLAQVKFTNKQLASRINEVYSKAKLNQNKLREQIVILERTGSGRVKTVKIGNVEISGVQMRRLLKLNSANFTISFSKDSVIFNTIGWGHGVGMSQTGAQAMAQNGASYDEIIKHYYKGVQIGKLK